MTKVLDSKTHLFNAISLCLAFCFVDFRFLDGNKEELRRKECESKSLVVELNELKMRESNKPLFGASDDTCDENSVDDDEKQLNAC